MQEISVYSQINNSPSLSTYKLPFTSSDQLSLSRSSPLSKHNIMQDEISRQFVLELIDGYLVCLINLIEQENQKKDREDFLYLANFCAENRLFNTTNNHFEQVKNSFLSQANNRLAQAYTLVNKLDYAQKYINVAMEFVENIDDYLLVYSTYYFILKSQEKHLENANLLLNLRSNTNIYSHLDEPKKIDFDVKLMTSLYYSHAYEDIIILLNETDRKYLYSDMTMMLFLISTFYKNGEKIQEVWDSLKHSLFKMTNVSYSKLRLAIRGKTSESVMRGNL